MSIMKEDEFSSACDFFSILFCFCLLSFSNDCECFGTETKITLSFCRNANYVRQSIKNEHLMTGKREANVAQKERKITMNGNWFFNATIFHCRSSSPRPSFSFCVFAISVLHSTRHFFFLVCHEFVTFDFRFYFFFVPSNFLRSLSFARNHFDCTFGMLHVVMNEPFSLDFERSSTRNNEIG